MTQLAECSSTTRPDHRTYFDRWCFSVGHDGWTSLKIYNILGQVVMTVYEGNATARRDYYFNVNMDRFATGVYFYALQQGTDMVTKKMILHKLNPILEI